MELISIVVPCYNEEKSIPIFYREINKVITKMKKVKFEFLFIDDGSTDETLEIIKELEKKDKSVRYISFSRNFGKEAGIYAGLEASKGDYVTLMDVDLQDPPELIPKMYDYIKKEGYDSVGTRRVTRKGEPVIRSFFARRFYKLINRISKVEMVDGARDFRLMSRQMVDTILSMKEYNRYSKGLFSFVGFNTKWLEYENRERVAGETKWSFWQLLMYALEGIVAFSTVPLWLASVIGVMFSLVSLILLIIYLFQHSSILIISAIIFMVSGVQLICIGILGGYLSKTYQETKKRPLYIIKEKK